MKVSSCGQRVGRVVVWGVIALSVIETSFISSASAQTPLPAPPQPSPAKRAVDDRKALYTLIASNFRPIAEVLAGRAEYDVGEVQKRTTRVAFLAGMTTDAFAPVSNTGQPATRAKSEIWSNRAEFDKRLAEFVRHTQALLQVATQSTSAGPDFKAAAVAVADDCKGCHDRFREK